MKLFPRAQVFHAKLKTENFVCTEMLDNRPWTYQHDVFCVASTIFTMLCGKYMNLLKRKRTPGYDTQTIPRYYKKQMWTALFNRMINMPDGNSQALLQDLRHELLAEIDIMTPHELKQKLITFNAAIEKDIN